MFFLHSVNTPEQAISADGIQQFDLSVNPLSVVLVCLRPLNTTPAVATFANYLEVAGAVNRCNIAFRGESVVSASGRDLAALNFFRHRIMPMMANSDDTDNERRCVVLPVLLGRMAYDPKSCFPASRRGELVLELDLDIADTGYDGLRLSIETIELLDAKPKEFERKVTYTQTNAATGDNDIDVPPGNSYRGLLLFGTTPFAGATPAPSWGRVSTRLDNQEKLFAATDFEVAHMLSNLNGGGAPSFDGHVHSVDASGAGVEYTGSPRLVGSGGWENYCFLDFDPSLDDTFSLNTKSASRFHVRSDAETADLVRVVGCERISV